jgi:hypothetical protein
MYDTVAYIALLYIHYCQTLYCIYCTYNSIVSDGDG